MNEEEKPGKIFRSEIAFIASIITIFVFVTGISSLGIFPPGPSSTPEPVQTTDIFPPPTSAPVTPTPVLTPAPNRPGPHDLVGQDGVASPTSSWLADYEIKYVNGTISGNAYLRWSPSNEGREYKRYVSEGEKVTVLASENGYSLVKTSDGRAGWVTSKLLK